MPSLADAITALRAELVEVEQRNEGDARFAWDEVTLSVGAQVSDARGGTIGLEILGVGLGASGGREKGEEMQVTITFRRLTADDGAPRPFQGIAGELRTEDGQTLPLHPDD